MELRITRIAERITRNAERLATVAESQTMFERAGAKDFSVHTRKRVELVKRRVLLFYAMAQEIDAIRAAA